MKTNIHSIERPLRILVGIGCVAMAFVGPANLWFLLGLIPLVTGLVGWCPIYALVSGGLCPRGSGKTSETPSTLRKD